MSFHIINNNTAISYMCKLMNICNLWTTRGALPLDPCRDLSSWSSLTFSRLDHCQCCTRAVDWALQANTPAASHCVHCAGLHSSVTHGIGSVTDIPHLCSGVNSSMMFHHYHLHSHKSSNVSNEGKSEHLLQPHRLTEQLQLRSIAAYELLCS